MEEKCCKNCKHWKYRIDDIGSCICLTQARTVTEVYESCKDFINGN